MNRRTNRQPHTRRVAVLLTALVASALATFALSGGTASADSYVPVSGEGSSWSANALNQWIADEQQAGMRINFTANGSTTGRQDFIKGLTDFAASDIPFQTNPSDGSAPEHPQAGSYAYMPITAGGTVFMYNLKINGQRVTNLRLSGQNITKIFTGAITNWNDPALAADNPALKLPNQSIVPVVRSDGSGSSFELTEWMIHQYAGLWNTYCGKTQHAGTCGATSFYPTVTGMIAQSGDLGVAGYVSQSYANGAIGYVNYSYALDSHFPVVQMLNAAGYYTEPTPQNVAVSLLQAQVDTTDVNNPALYLTQKLDGVYNDADPRAYPLSSYGYLVLPTTVAGQFTAAKGKTLAAFSYYAMCGGQKESAALGYSPMPINLVQASFDQIKKIPGAVVQNINIQSCGNPTFSPSGANLLATTAPFPPACDKQGPTQCTTGTGGAVAVSTPVSPGSAAAATQGKGSTSSTAAGTGSGTNAGSVAAGAAGTGTSAGDTATTATTAPCDPSTGSCPSSGSIGLAGAAPAAATATLPAATGWSTNQTLLVLIGLLLLAIILIPGLLVRRMDRGKQ